MDAELCVVVVATIRSTELEARMPGSGLSSSLGQALTDDELVVDVAWPTGWSDQERERAGEHIKNPALLEWAAAGNCRSRGSWLGQRCKTD